tara:strand:- start:1528 stop:1950 length:423 start_codon:yes stop_codon:yes gene_type:complete
MQRFKQYLQEHDRNTHDYYETSPAAGGFADPMVIRKINAILGKICESGPVGCPSEAVARIRHSLSLLHLQFGEPNLAEDKASLDMPLSAYGGRFGKDENTPHNEFLEDDGLSHQVEGGLTLNLTYEKVEHNLFQVYAEIK